VSEKLSLLAPGCEPGIFEFLIYFLTLLLNHSGSPIPEKTCTVSKTKVPASVTKREKFYGIDKPEVDGDEHPNS
jgi:hypothetical protein